MHTGNINTYYNINTVGPQHLYMCHFNVKGVQISEFVWISELSDKIYYLAS